MQLTSITPTSYKCLNKVLVGFQSNKRKKTLALPPLKRTFGNGKYITTEGVKIRTGVKIKPPYDGHLATGFLFPDKIKELDPKIQQYIFTTRQLIQALDQHKWFKAWFTFMNEDLETSLHAERDKTGKPIIGIQQLKSGALGADLKSMMKVIQTPMPAIPPLGQGPTSNFDQVSVVTKFINEHLAPLIQNLRIEIQRLTPEERQRIIAFAKPAPEEMKNPDRVILKALLGKKPIVRFVRLPAKIARIEDKELQTRKSKKIQQVPLKRVKCTGQTMLLFFI
jgi:hypothetical protein